MALSRKALLIRVAAISVFSATAVIPRYVFSDSSVVAKGSTYGLRVSQETVSSLPVRDLLGIHSLWWGHKEGIFADDATGTRKEVIDLLAAAGGSLRYGGGANEISWRACAGPLHGRPAVKAAAWAGPMQCVFGIDEYLALAKAASSSSTWLISNIAGINHVPMPIDEMSLEAAAAARYVAAAAPVATRYWELGNELERGRYGWSPERIGERASAAGRAILSADPDARLVIPLIEFNHPKQPRRQVFNQRLMDDITVPVSAFALHLYYDGRPGGPPVSTQLETVRESARLIARSRHSSAAIWITEHGRWPEGSSDDPTWRSRWTQTNDMNGVMATADFLIGLTQIGKVKGAHLHGLRAGPWNVVERASNRAIVPTGVGELLALFGHSGAERRLISATTSRNDSGYAGGYDLRAAAFIGEDGQLVVWAVNRAATPILMTIESELDVAAGGAHRGHSLVCVRPPAECSAGNFRTVSLGTLRANDGMPKQINLPAHSVSVLHLELVK